ncbi:FAD-dependent oxidoreductase [Maricurvus nonylphenolicus]|uniref:phytoene desaturase family protein n=1 Tax=Maricurvus nonylphenolicus TaxID=1008307 RepID=UPI0036F397E9
MTVFDAIVIGAGNAGLTAATALQRGGANTLLLERHNIPGGCATSFVRGDFEFEVALHQLSGMGTEEQPFVMRQIFDQLGIMDKIEVVEEHDLYRMVLPGEIDITLPADWDGLQQVLIERFPHEAEAIPRFMQVVESISLESFINVPQLQRNNDQEFLDNQCVNYKRYGLRPAKEVFSEFFSDEDLIAVLGAYWCYLGVATKDLPFVDLAVMIYVYGKFKPTHIKGGSQAISSALLESFQQAGGQVKFNCGAEKILTENGVVTGVIAENGERYQCKTVISNASPIHTYHELLDMPKLPQQASQDLKSRRIGTSAFVLYVGVDQSPEELGIKNASTFIVDNRDEEKAIEAMGTLDAPSSIMVTCYNIEDPDFAPPGKSSLSILCLQYGEPWESVPEEKYTETKYQLAETLIKQAERVYPGIQEHLEQIEVATPLTMMRYLNTPGGAIYGFDQNTQDSNIFRERMDAIDGLYMSSAWYGMGGFQPTYMSGHKTGHVALKYIATAEETQEVAENA